MKYVMAVVAGFLLAAVLLVAVLGSKMLASARTVGDMPPLTPADLTAVRSLLQQAMLRNQDSGKLQQLAIRSRELEKALNYLLDARLNGDARVTINKGIARVALSVPVPANPFGSWVNMEVAVVKGEDLLLHVQHLQIGSLAIPAFIADRLMLHVHADLQAQQPDYAHMVASITDIVIGTDQLTISYRWQRELLDQLAARGRTLMLDPEHQARLTFYAQQLALLANDAALPERLSVASLLSPMFALARQRGGSAVEENRAVLQILAMYALDVDPARVLGEIPGLGSFKQHDIRLASRHDFALHLLVSAGLDASTDSNLATDIGQLKEQLDTKASGTGFSFTDLAIDRTGARLGELAVSNENNAKHVQQLLADPSVRESLFMPPLQDLPEFMSEVDFAKRFVTVGSPAYNAMIDSIEGRIKLLPLFAGQQ
jgi:hypothetical protein